MTEKPVNSATFMEYLNAVSELCAAISESDFCKHILNSVQQKIEDLAFELPLEIKALENMKGFINQNDVSS